MLTSRNDCPPGCDGRTAGILGFRWKDKGKPVLLQPKKNLKMNLPKTISCGDELEVQLCPYGDFEKSGILQRCDSAAFQRLLNNFDGRREVLVDFDHAAEQGGSTRAAAWLTARAFASPRWLRLRRCARVW